MQMFLTRSRLRRGWSELVGIMIYLVGILIYSWKFVFLVITISMDVLDYLFTFKF